MLWVYWFYVALLVLCFVWVVKEDATRNTWIKEITMRLDSLSKKGELTICMGECVDGALTVVEDGGR